MTKMRNVHDDATKCAANIDEILLRAEESQQERIMQPPESMEALSIEAVQQLIHDLQVQQIELEMQNNELRRIQSELDDARSRYFDMYEYAPGGYFLLNEQGQLVEANSSFAALLGIEKKILIDQPLTRFICSEDQDKYYLHRVRLLKHGVTPACELRLKRGDGTIFWVRLEANVLQNANGTSMVRGMGLDITDLKLAQAEVLALNEVLEERVRERTRQLEESNRLMSDIADAKATFLANMSHELRTPLNIVIGFSEVLQDQLFGTLNEKQAEYIDNIVNSGQHLLSLVNDVLDLSKIESGKMELDWGLVNMADLCRETLRMLQGRAMKQGIDLQCHIDIATNVERMVDGRKIKQILFNLVDNGIKFNRPGGGPFQF